jgi:hypothetical protein
MAQGKRFKVFLPIFVAMRHAYFVSPHSLLALSSGSIAYSIGLLATHALRSLPHALIAIQNNGCLENSFFLLPSSFFLLPSSFFLLPSSLSPILLLFLRPFNPIFLYFLLATCALRSPGITNSQ